MSLTGEEIRANLTRFAARWGTGDWGERREAQTFLNELFQAYGMDRRSVAEFERFESGGFFDLIWPGVCLIEMKGTGEANRLSKHRVQALQYWRDAANESKGIPAPRYVVVCAFRRFEIWQPGEFPAGPRVAFDLAELPDRFEVLGFLVGEEPLFDTNRAAVTIEAASQLADLNESLDERGESGPDDRRLFILQCVWCMFAEDMGQIQGQRFTKIIDSLISHPSRSSADDLGALFQYLNDPSPQRPDHGLYKGVPYADGKLFEQPARLNLTIEELELLREACRSNWHEVQPSIFGSLLQGVLGREKQWELGAHYTHESEIQKIVLPTIVEPWVDRVENLDSLKEARRAQQDLLNYVVLDSACGSGNFLYVAYRELRRIEARLAQRVADLAKAAGRTEQEGLRRSSRS